MRTGFINKDHIGTTTFKKLGIIRIEEFNLKNDLKLGMFIV